jgi:hypothetical protein
MGLEAIIPTLQCVDAVAGIMSGINMNISFSSSNSIREIRAIAVLSIFIKFSRLLKPTPGVLVAIRDKNFFVICVKTKFNPI